VDPLVSIACIAYNHDTYIGAAIDSFLMQETNFAYEIVIHDDASSDNTADIIQQYQQKYPDLISSIIQGENQYSKGINPLVRYVFPKCRGKYIAICEADDYWTDALKLQKQVDTLSTNNELSLCFHNALVKNESVRGRDRLFCDETIAEITGIENVISKYYIHTASMVFKKAALDTPSWLQRVYNGDWAIQLILAKNGKIKYLDDVMSVYRRQPGGFNSTMQEAVIQEHKIKLISYFNLYTEFQYDIHIQKKMHHLLEEYRLIFLLNSSPVIKIFSGDYWKFKLNKLLKKLRR
jgi:glycosyltransferase involved in cell wall biosynthesis